MSFPISFQTSFYGMSVVGYGELRATSQGQLIYKSTLTLQACTVSVTAVEAKSKAFCFLVGL